MGDWVATDGARVDPTTRLRIRREDPGVRVAWARGAARASLIAQVEGASFTAPHHGAALTGRIHPDRCALVVQDGAEAPVELSPTLKGELLPWAPCTEAATLVADGQGAVVTADGVAALPEGCVGEATLYLDERRVEGALTVDGARWSMAATVAKAPAQAELHRASRCGEAPPTGLGVACLGFVGPEAVH